MRGAILALQAVMLRKGREEQKRYGFDMSVRRLISIWVSVNLPLAAILSSAADFLPTYVLMGKRLAVIIGPF